VSPPAPAPQSHPKSRPKPRDSEGMQFGPHPGPGILTWFPFDTGGARALGAPRGVLGCCPQVRRGAAPRPTLSRTGFPRLSGPTDPCPIDVDMEPFSNFGPQAVPLEYLLLPPRSTLRAVPPGVTPGLRNGTLTPSYSSGPRSRGGGGEGTPRGPPRRQLTAGSRCARLAPSIFEAHSFGR